MYFNIKEKTVKDKTWAAFFRKFESRGTPHMLETKVCTGLPATPIFEVVLTRTDKHTRLLPGFLGPLNLYYFLHL